MSRPPSSPPQRRGQGKVIVAIAVVVFLVVVGFVWVRYFGGIGFFQYYLDKLW